MIPNENPRNTIFKSSANTNSNFFKGAKY